MSKYLLTIKIPIESFDSLTVRSEVNKILDISGLKEIEKSLKLQEIFDDKPPVGMKI